MGAYTAYLLEYDPKTRIGFGAVTMGYGWELGNMSLDEMQEVKVHGLGIERDPLFHALQTPRNRRTRRLGARTIHQGKSTDRRS